MSALTISKLCKAFGGLHVTTDVDLSVEAGSLVAVMGSSGSGKTSLTPPRP